MDPPKDGEPVPVHLAECRSPDQVEGWLKRHVDQWHYGVVKPGCGLCELALAKMIRLHTSGSPSEPMF